MNSHIDLRYVVKNSCRCWNRIGMNVFPIPTSEATRSENSEYGISRWNIHTVRCSRLASSRRHESRTTMNIHPLLDVSFHDTSFIERVTLLAICLIFLDIGNGGCMVEDFLSFQSSIIPHIEVNKVNRRVITSCWSSQQSIEISTRGLILLETGVSTCDEKSSWLERYNGIVIK